MLSLPVSVLNTLRGKNSRQRTHLAEPFHRSIRSFSPAPVELMRLSCLPTIDTFKAWPESDVAKSSVSKFSRFKIVLEESKELPVTEETLRSLNEAKKAIAKLSR